MLKQAGETETRRGVLLKAYPGDKREIKNRETFLSSLV